MHADPREERWLAALAHALALLHVPGVLVTLAVYLGSRERRPYAAEHARQALAFQVAVQGLLALAALAGAGLLSWLGHGLPPRTALAVAVAPPAAVAAGGAVLALAAAARAWRGLPPGYPLLSR